MIGEEESDDAMMKSRPGPESSRSQLAALVGSQEAQSRLQLDIDCIPGLTWSGGPDGSVEFLNKQWRDYTGLSLEQALGWKWAQTIHPDDLPQLQKLWREILRTGVPTDVEARVRRYDGTYRWFLFRCSALRDGSGSIIRWYGTNTDIEIRKRTEQALRASEALFRCQFEVLKNTVDALATESTSDKLVGQVLGSMKQHFSAHSIGVYCRDSETDRLGIEFVLEDRGLRSRADLIRAGVDPWLPMGDDWPWSSVIRTGRPSLMEDIRTVPQYSMRDHLLSLGVTTILSVPMRVGGELAGTIGLRFAQRRQFTEDELDIARTLATQVMLVVQISRAIEKDRKAAVLMERNRIARDIHDTIAQGLTGVIVQLQAADEANARGALGEAGVHVRLATHLARDSLNEARRSVHALRPEALKDKVLSEALDGLLTNLTLGTDLQSRFEVIGEPKALHPEWEENLFRIGQEVLTNTLRHARATQVAVRIEFQPDLLLMDITDNGQGFDLSQPTDGYGLLGIQERLGAMGGTLEVRTAAGQGTAVKIALPTARGDGP